MDSKKVVDKEIGLRIRSCRDALGYSREILSEKAELSNSFLSSIELGTGSCTAEYLQRLCKALGVSADYILYGSENKGDLTQINAMLSGLDPEYIPYVEQLLSAFLTAIHAKE